MKRFVVVSLSEARSKGYPDVDVYGAYGNAGALLYETDGKKPIRLISDDGGEPEDQSFFRDWKWVAPLLNKLADELKEAKEGAEKTGFELPDGTVIGLTHEGKRKLLEYMERQPKIDLEA